MSDETLTFGMKVKKAKPELNRGGDPTARTQTPDFWQVGDWIDGRYEVKEIVGKGGMGVVYRIFHQEWNISLGVKALLPSLIADEPSKQRFIREAQTWIDLGMHPNIVQCWYAREIDGLLLLFLEFIQDGSLKAWLDKGRVRPREWPRIVDFAIQAADGLGFAHDQGLVHRDVKPANMMMAKNDRLCVTDFGIVKSSHLADIAGGAKDGLTTGTQVTLTQADSGMGTPEYGAPEQWIEAKSVDARADIYALGVVLFEMCCGKRPFDNGDHKEPAHVLIGRHLSEAPRDPNKLNPEVPVGLADLMLQCLAKDPENRPGSMDDVRDRLSDIYSAASGVPYPRKKPAAADLRADSLNNKAVSLWDLGRKKEAVELFKSTIRVDPQHLEATANLGVIEWRHAKITDEGFVKRLRGLETVHGERALYWKMLGEAHLCRRSADEAVKSFIKALDINPEDQLARQLLSNARQSVESRDRHFRCIRTIKDGDPIVALGFGADGQSFMAANPMGLKWWRLTTHYVSTAIGNQTDIITCMAVSPKDRTCAVGNTEHTVHLWNLKTKQCTHVFRGHQNAVNCVAFLPGKSVVLSGGSDATVRLWDHRRSQPCLHVFERHERPITCMAVSKDGKCFISGELYNRLILWEITSRTFFKEYRGHANGVSAVAMLPNGKHFLSAGKEGSLRLWRIADGKCLRVLTGHTGGIADIAVSRDGQYAVTGSRDKTLRIWHLPSGVCLRTINEHKHPIDAMSHSSKSGCLISGGEDMTIRFWNIRFDAWQVPIMLNISEIRDFHHIVGEQEKAGQLLRQSEDHLRQGAVSEAIDKLRSIKQIPGFERDQKVLDLWNRAAKSAIRSRVVTGWTNRVLKLHDGSVNAIDWHPDGTRAASAGDDAIIRLFDAKTGKILRTFTGHSDAVTSVRFSPDGRRLLSGSADKTMRLWSVSSGQCEKVFYDHFHGVTAVEFFHSGEMGISTENDKSVEFDSHGGAIFHSWDMTTGKSLRVFEGHADSIKCVALTPDDQIVITGSSDRTVRVWRLNTGECVHVLEGHSDAVTALSIAREGGLAMSVSKDQQIILWEYITGKRLIHFKPKAGPIRCLSVFENGRFGILAIKGALQIVNFAAGARLGIKYLTGHYPNVFLSRLEGHDKTVNAVAVSPDGRFVLSGSTDHTIRLWELDWELDPEGKTSSLQESLKEKSNYHQNTPAKTKAAKAYYQQKTPPTGNDTEWNRFALQCLFFLPRAVFTIACNFIKNSTPKAKFIMISLVITLLPFILGLC